MDDICIGNHSDLHRIGADVCKYAVNLPGYKFRRYFHDAIYSGCILRRQSGYDT